MLTFIAQMTDFLKRKPLTLLCSVLILFLSSALYADSSGSISYKLPLEVPLCKLAHSFQGPEAMAVGAIGLFLMGVILIFNEGDLTDFTRRLTFMMFGLSLLIGGVSTIHFFNISMINNGFPLLPICPGDSY